jgi:branched-chain amino acid transport system substrate-binding protein
VLLAIDDINATGGVAALGGARLEAVLGDRHGRLRRSAAEVEQMNDAGVAALIDAGGGAGSGTQEGMGDRAADAAPLRAAAAYALPYMVAIGAPDRIDERSLPYTFCFGPSRRDSVQQALHDLQALNVAAGRPLATATVVGTKAAPELSQLARIALQAQGFELKASFDLSRAPHQIDEAARRIKAVGADLLVSTLDDDAVLPLALALRRLDAPPARPAALCAFSGGALLNSRVIREFPEAADLMMVCGAWFDARDGRARSLRARIEARHGFFSSEHLMGYHTVGLLADALERAGSARREDVAAALRGSAWDGHFMPYGPTRFVDGRNLGARPALLQMQNGHLKLIGPARYAEADPVFASSAA